MRGGGSKQPGNTIITSVGGIHPISSLHDIPPVLQKHLSRCPQNQQRAGQVKLDAPITATKIQAGLASRWPGFRLLNWRTSVRKVVFTITALGAN